MSARFRLPIAMALLAAASSFVEVAGDVVFVTPDPTRADVLGLAVESGW